MAKQPAKNLNVTVNAVALENDFDSFSLNWTQETPVVTGIGESGPRRVVGNNDYELQMSGALDFTAAKSDATLAALIGSAGVATTFDPTGAAAGPNDPNYDSASMVLSSYQISASGGGRVEGSATLQGNAALVRAIA